MSEPLDKRATPRGSAQLTSVPVTGPSVARVTLSRNGRVVSTDAFVIPSDSSLESLTVPLQIGWRSAELRIDFDPPVVTEL